VPAKGDEGGKAGGDLGPLPSGHHGLSREEVAESQRERLLAATADVIAELGYTATPISEIVKRASVANRVFYANFKDKEEAFTVTFDAVAGHLAILIGEAAEPVEEWPLRVTTGLRAALEFFDAEPVLARFCVVAPFTATKSIAGHCRDVAARAIPYLADGRDLHEGEPLPESTEDAMVGGILSQLSRSILNESGPMIVLLPDLVEFCLSPYLGSEAARRFGAEAIS